MAVPFWSLNPTAGYFGPIYPSNPFDLVILGGEKLPGICKIKALPAQEISRQKVPGRDGATILWRGYVPGPVDLECLMWMDAQWQIMQGIISRLWQKPGKTLAGKGGAKKESGKALENQAAIAEGAATDIDHPSLQVLGITRVILSGVSLPEEGSAPQSRTINFKLLEYVPPGKKTVSRKVAGSGKLPTFATVGGSPNWDTFGPPPNWSTYGPPQANAGGGQGPSPGEKEAGPHGPPRAPNMGGS
jgi:hypothetical protein